MATLKGQNFRVGIKSSVADFVPIGMSTNCVVTLTNNTDDSSTKDDVGMASKPVVTSKSWSVQVDSLNVLDAGAMLSAIKASQPLLVMWDETSTTDNYTAEHATFARKGYVYMNDLTLTFNDRENSAKNIQMTGTGALETVANTDIFNAPGTTTYTKGQFVRLFLSSDNTAAPSAVVGAAKQMSIHVSVSLEDASTKDTDGEWMVQEPTAISYDISTSALMRGNDTITSAVAAKGLSDLETIYESGTPVKWQIANTSGANNRTKGSVIVSGSAVLQTLTLNGPNRQNANYTAQLAGYGEFTVGS